MGMQDTFADAVSRAQQGNGMNGLFTAPPPPQPAPAPTSGPGSPADMLGGAVQAAPQVHINVGQPAGPPVPGDAAMANAQGLGQMDDQERQRQAFAASLPPDVSQAFAAFMNGIAEQESLKNMAATPQRMFGG